MSDFEDVRKRIEAAFADRQKLADPVYKAAVVQALARARPRRAARRREGRTASGR